MDLFPAPNWVFERFAEQAIAGPGKRKQFLSLLNLFGITRYAEKNRLAMIALAERGINPFDYDTGSASFSGIYPEFSFSILFEKTDDFVPQRAAKLVSAALAYRQALQDGGLEKEVSGGAVMDQERYKNLFGRVANIRKTGLLWKKLIRHCTTSAHIAVAVDGSFYKLDVIDGNGMPISAQDILHGIDSIIRTAAADNSPSKPYGVITTNITKSTAGFFCADKPDESITIIDEAIFLIAIDTTACPSDENGAARNVHMLNYQNRDYRKSLQLVVLGNGFSGATFSLFAGIEGGPAARFASWINSYAKMIPQLLPTKKPVSHSKLEFATIDFAALPLDRLKAKIVQSTCDLPLIKNINAMGKDAIKALNVSPDAFFHAAAHLAYYEKFSKVPSVHNFVDMRGVKFGSITRYVSTTDEMARFLQSQTKANLLDAFRAHKDRVSAIKSEGNPIHYAYYYLYTTMGLRFLLAMALFRIFVPDLFTKHISPDIWASNIPILPGIYCAGRFGVFFTFARDNCLAGNYLIFPDHIRVCFLANKRSFLESWPFDQALSDAMIQLKTILS